MKGSHVFLCLFSVSCCSNLMPTAGNKIFHLGPCRVSMSMTEIRSGFTAIKANIQARDPIRTLSILSYPHSLHKVKTLMRSPLSLLQAKETQLPQPFLIREMFHSIMFNTITFSKFLRNADTEQVREDKVMWIRYAKRDRCCITHHLFTFYVDKVFKHCKTEDSYVNRKISSIANSFLSVKRRLGQCYEQNKCTCGQESTEKFKQVLANYAGLNVTSAAIKSLGELDILLDWLEKSP